MAGFTLEIHCAAPGQYVCTNESDEQEAQEGPENEGTPQDLQEDAQEGQTFQSPEQVVQWVQQQLQGAGGAQGQDPKASWDAEAASRDAQGFRKPAGGAPAMTM